MKSEKGITMIALIITLIVMAILTGIIVNTSSKVLKDAELQDMVTNMLLIQAKVKTGVEETKFKTFNKNNQSEISNIKNENLIGEQIDINNETNDVTDILQNILGEEDLAKTWYCLENDDLKEMGLYELMSINGEKQYYLYTYDENTLDIEIVYTRGYTHSDNTTYYKLSDLEGLLNS